MFEETIHGLPQPDSPRMRAMRRQCKRLRALDIKTSDGRGVQVNLSEPQEAVGGCPCVYEAECWFHSEVQSNQGRTTNENAR